MATIVVGPYTVDATQCQWDVPGGHKCVHDWRITGPAGVKSLTGKPDQFWDNVEKTGDTHSDAQ
ncbi:hypothetical protein [Mycobacterium intracellulare]|uniref:Uncharacterized protein n=1 Tax=Mycobacterium intracellulare TaxID=1767 RepID=A0A7R7MYY0_MYCIT|nr:hypothetical protein [Mycobacterium intracellulare]BCP02520.1 hypothetical protein MINTM018_52890 [Mycobacterium intracellulare]